MKKYILLLIFIFLLAACNGAKVKPIIDDRLLDKKTPDQEIYNFNVKITEGEILKAILYADTLRKYSETNETLLSNVFINFYNKEGGKTSDLKSEYGKIDDATNDMYAIKNVVAKNKKGIRLLTEELMWRNKDKKIVTDKFVTILNGSTKTEGYGFESDQSLTNYQIFNPTYKAKKVSGKK